MIPAQWMTALLALYQADWLRQIERTWVAVGDING